MLGLWMIPLLINFWNQLHFYELILVSKLLTYWLFKLTTMPGRANRACNTKWGIWNADFLPSIRNIPWLNERKRTTSLLWEKIWLLGIKNEGYRNDVLLKISQGLFQFIDLTRKYLIIVLYHLKFNFFCNNAEKSNNINLNHLFDRFFKNNRINWFQHKILFRIFVLNIQTFLENQVSNCQKRKLITQELPTAR